MSAPLTESAMLLFLSALGFAAPVDLPIPTTNATVHRLDNGLTVLIDEDDRTDSVLLHIKYGVGARDEADGEHGCAHLFEHLMFEGSANVPNNAFDTWLTAGGGSNNAYTSDDETAYHMTFPSGALDLALFLESDRLGFLDAGLDTENLENQKLVVLQEREQGFADPHGRDFEALIRIQYPMGHPYHVPTIGTVADVEGFTIEAVTDFWRRHYRTQNAVMVVTGGIKEAEAMERITHWFSDIPDAGPALERSKPWDKPYVPADGVLYDDVEDRTLYISYATVPLSHEDTYALDLLGYVLDNGRGTRMADALYYASNLATSAWASSWNSEIDGQFILSAASPSTPLAKLEKKMDAAIKDIIKNPPTADEIERARQSVYAGLQRSLESPNARARMLVSCFENTGTPNCLADEWTNIQAVTAEDIVRVASTWLTPERRITLSVVPRDDTGFIAGATEVEIP